MSAYLDEDRYDPDNDTGYDLSEDDYAAIMKFRNEEAIGGYLDPAAYDLEANVGFDLPEGLPELEPLYALSAARQKATVKQGVMEVVGRPTEPPYTSVGRVFTDDKHGNAFLASCCRLRFDHLTADAIIGPNGVLSSARLFCPLEDVAAAHVRFEASDGKKYDFSVRKIAVPRAYTEATNAVARYCADYSVLHLDPITGPSLSEVVPALPATLGRTLLLPGDSIRKVGFGRTDDGDPELHEDEGHFMIELGPGKAVGAEGPCKRGMSGGPASQGGKVVGVNCAGSIAHDVSVVSRVYLSELENMVEKEPDWQGSG